MSIFTTWLDLGSLAGAAQLSCFMLAIVACLIAIERYGRRNDSGVFRRKPAADAAIAAERHQGRAALVACLLPVLLGFVVPVLYLLQQSFGRGLLANFDMSLGRDAFNSVAFATLATLIALTLGSRPFWPGAGGRTPRGLSR